MRKLTLAVLLGAGLGLLDGLSTYLDPEAVELGIVPVAIVASTLKGLLSGVVIGWVAERWRSLRRDHAAGRRAGPGGGLREPALGAGRGAPGPLTPRGRGGW